MVSIIRFNPKKSVCFKVGHDKLKSLKLEWVDRIKYLAIMFLAGSAMRVDTSYIRRKFYTTQRLDVRLSRLLVGFQMHFKSMHFHSFIACIGILSYMYSRSVDEFVKLVLSKPSVYHCLPITLVPWIYLLPVLGS